MDRTIKEKFGINFHAYLVKKADSLFLARTIKDRAIVNHGDCDKKPLALSETGKTNDPVPIIVVTKPGIKEKKVGYDNWPHLVLKFTVETDSTISDVHVTDFTAQVEENKQYKDQLISIAIEHVKMNYPVWIPGQINGVPVRASSDITVHFTKNE